MSDRIVVVSPLLPAPAGPYSHAVRTGGLIAIAGQAGFNDDGGLADGIEEQTRTTLKNVAVAIEAAGGRLEDALHVRVYLTSTKHFEGMNVVYREFFTTDYPARTTVYVSLPIGILVEIDALVIAP